jgi:hypothetical protein
MAGMVYRRWVLPQSHAVLTFATRKTVFDDGSVIVNFGWSICNPNDNVQWSKKIGNQIARDRFDAGPMCVIFSQYEQVNSFWIAAKILMSFLAASDQNGEPFATTPKLNPSRKSEITKMLADFIGTSL